MRFDTLKEKNELLIGTSEFIHVVDLNTRKETRNIAFHKSPVFNIQYSFSQGKVFVATGEGNISVWSLDDFTLLYNISLCKEKYGALL